jgi:hypothetical protein
MPTVLDPPPVRAQLGITLCGLAVGIFAIGADAAIAPPAVAAAPTIAIAPPPEVVTVAPPTARVHETEPARGAEGRRDSSDDIELAFVAGGDTYLALRDVDATALPRHGRLRMITDEYVDGAIARLDAVPADLRAWQGREVIVDSTCRATVTGFALIARLTGDPGYAGVEGDDAAWKPAQIFDHGHVMIAAKLDRCTGTYARAASATPIVVFEPGTATAAQLAQARMKVLASHAAAAATKEWKSFDQPGRWFDANLGATTVRDPRTSTTWISMHGHVEEDCGGPTVNLWGLFRVEPDGTLATVQLRPLETLTQIDKLVDVDGDGVPELVGRGWINPDALITDASGHAIVSLETPFYGCPC